MRPLTLLALLAAAVIAAEPAGKKTVEVPYKLTQPKHILVRAKINGKGPFNFIMDTGAPALFFTEAVAAKAGVKADEKGWGACETFELEGGLVVPSAKGRVDTPFQLEGMNGMGIGGAEIHGLIGYNILARYRITIDLSSDRMRWTPLDWKPDGPMGVRNQGGGSDAGQTSLELMGSMMKGLGGLLGRKATPTVTARGQAGLVLRDETAGPVVASVLKGWPAEAGGIKPGDRLVMVDGKTVTKASEALGQVEKMEAGRKLPLSLDREGKRLEVVLELAEGY
ncbi:MAG: PDZ domain-containing protein [Planctomycetota bacterium]